MSFRTFSSATNGCTEPLILSMTESPNVEMVVADFGLTRRIS